jgi:hypothetical protein
MRRRWKATVSTIRLPAIAVVVAALVVASAAGAAYRSEVSYTRGLVSFHQEKWEQALLAFDEAVQAEPRNAVALYYRGLCNARLGMADQARSDLERALELRPDLPALDLGIIYFEQGRSEQAELWLQRAYRQPENRFAAALFLGLSHFRRGDDAAAHEFFQDAAKDPRLRQTAQYYDALLALRAGRTGEGRQLLGEVAQLNAETEIGRIAQQTVGEEGSPAMAVEAEKPWAIGGYAGFEFDSNVPLAANDSDVRKSRGIDDEEDGRSVLGIGAAYRIVDSNLVQGTLSYGLSQSLHFQINEFDLQGHRVRLDLSTPGNGLQYGVTGLYDFYLLDFEEFYQQGLAIPWIAYHESDVTATQLYYRFRSRDFLDDPFDPFRDGYNNAVGLRQLFLLGAIGRQLSAGYQWEDENPISDDGNDFESAAHQIDLRLDFELVDWATFLAGYLFRLEDYQFRNSRTGSPPAFGRRRHDRQHQLVFHVERPLIPHLIAEIEYLGVINDTNIDEFEYNRHVLSAAVRVEF